MVCVAAFIVLCLLSVFVGFLSIFNRKLGKKYWSVFQKAWHCVFKKVRLQKCDTNFKDDVKNTLLKRVVLKHPKLLRPLSNLIEFLSVIIVFVTIWSIIISIKSLLALWAFGTCNVSQPSQCSLGSEVCSIDQSEPTDLLGKIGRSFSEWGEIFSAIPDRLKTWDAKDYFVSSSVPLLNFSQESSDPTLSLTHTQKLLQFYKDKTLPDVSRPTIDLVDPSCIVCMQSYRNQKSSSFLDNHFVVANLYAIPKSEGGYKFENSKLITDYINSVVFLIQNDLDLLTQKPDFEFTKLNQEQQIELGNFLRLPTKLIDRLYTGSKNNQNYLQLMNYSYDHRTALEELNSWSEEFGFSQTNLKVVNDVIQIRHFNQVLKDEQAKRIVEKISQSDQEIKDLVENKIKAKGIPVEIYDQKKHNGLFKI